MKYYLGELKIRKQKYLIGFYSEKVSIYLIEADSYKIAKIKMEEHAKLIKSNLSNLKNYKIEFKVTPAI